MSPVGWLPTVAELCELDPPVFVFGGIAEEALLEGTVSREHGDIDVLVDRKALRAHIEAFEAIGYPAPQVYFEVVPGQPLVLGTERDGMPLEVGVYDEIEAGVASFVLPTERGLTRFNLPEDTFHHPITEIDGTPVRTVSPLALFHLREAFILSGRAEEALRLRTVPA